MSSLPSSSCFYVPVKAVLPTRLPLGLRPSHPYIGLVTSRYGPTNQALGWVAHRVGGKCRLPPLSGLPPTAESAQQQAHQLGVHVVVFLEACADQFFLQLRLWWLDMYIALLDALPRMQEAAQTVLNTTGLADIVTKPLNEEEQLQHITEDLQEAVSGKVAKAERNSSNRARQQCGRRGSRISSDTAREEQQQLRFTMTEAPLQFSTLTASPLLQCGGILLVLAAACSLVPAMLKQRSEARAMQEAIEEQKFLNGQSLRRQKQRFQQALHFDSINLELPDIREAPVDPNNSGRLKAVPRMTANESKARKEWEKFMESSKMGQVVNMWDAKADDPNGAPRVSRQQLEEMTERVRSANKPAQASADSDGKGSSSSGDSKKGFVTFDELYADGADFDNEMAERVARRKARFKGQFLNDEDVGMKKAPTRKKGGYDNRGMGSQDGSDSDEGESSGGRLWGGGASAERDQAVEADNRSMHQERRRKMMAAEGGGPGQSEEMLEVRPKHRQAVSGEAVQQLPPNNGGLLEIKPRRQAVNIEAAQQLPPTNGGLLEIKPKRQAVSREAAQQLPTNNGGLLEIKPRRQAVSREAAQQLPPNNGGLLEIKPRHGSQAVISGLEVQHDDASLAGLRVQEAQHSDASAVTAPPVRVPPASRPKSEEAAYAIAAGASLAVSESEGMAAQQLQVSEPEDALAVAVAGAGASRAQRDVDPLFRLMRKPGSKGRT